MELRSGKNLLRSPLRLFAATMNENQAPPPVDAVREEDVAPEENSAAQTDDGQRTNGESLISQHMSSHSSVASATCSNVKGWEEERMMMKRVERVAKKIAPCNGEKENEVREWLRAVETSGLSEQETVLLAQETARGKLFRELVRQKRQTWREVKSGIQGVFVAHNHAALQRQALHRVRQDPRESLRHFNLRFRELIEEAFEGSLSSAEEEFVVNAYLAALASDRVVDRVLEDGKVPSHLTVAMEKASGEDRIQEMKRAAGRSTHQDINEIREREPEGSAALDQKIEALTAAVASLVAKSNGPAPCGHCGKLGHSETSCWAKHGRPGAGRQRTGNLRWTDDGQPICAACQQAGHLRRECPRAAGMQPKN